MSLLARGVPIFSRSEGPALLEVCTSHNPLLSHPSPLTSSLAACSASKYSQRTTIGGISSFPICTCAKCATGSTIAMDGASMRNGFRRGFCSASTGNMSSMGPSSLASSMKKHSILVSSSLLRSNCHSALATSRVSVGSISTFPICQCAKCAGGAGDIGLRMLSTTRKCFYSSAAAAAAATTTSNTPSSHLQGIGAPKDIDFTDARRKGLAWRAKQRGWLELDWLMGTFAQKYLANLDENQLQLFEELLEVDNPDLFNWLSAQEPAPEHMLKNEVYMMMAEYVNAEHPSIMKKMEGDNQNLG